MDCLKFRASDEGSENMMIGKTTDEVITTINEMIGKCLNCEHINNDCAELTRRQLLDFLEENENKQ